MILVFIILGIVIIFSILILILMFSNIKLNIKEIHIKKDNKGIKIDFILIIEVYIFCKIKIYKFMIDKYKINNVIESKKIDIQKIKSNKEINEYLIKLIKNKEYNIEYFKIDGYFATFNTVLSSSIYGIINIIIPILIAPRINKKNYINNIKFLQLNKNIIDVYINCIINIKIVNIINIVHFAKKKGGKIKNGKSSNRRAYAYSNE